MKQAENVGVKLTYPIPGQGRHRTSAEKTWILETYSDEDSAGNRVHRKSTSCAIHFLNGTFFLTVNSHGTLVPPSRRVLTSWVAPHVTPSSVFAHILR